MDAKSNSEKIDFIKLNLDVKKVNTLSKDELEPTIFLPILTHCNSTLSELIESIVSSLKISPKSCEVGDRISATLKACYDILHCINEMLVEVNKMELKKIIYGFSIPKIIASILLGVFQHCQISESIYGDLLSSAKELLVALFHKANELQANFFVFLNDKITFNCTLQNELDLLVEVMDLLAQIGEVLLSLDIKTLATLWKGYMQLTDAYIQDLRMWLDVTKPITFLANDIKIRLQKVSFSVGLDIPPNDDRCKHLIKDLKLGCFLLKIIVKLCELYNDHLGNCHRELVNLLINLNGFSTSYLHMYQLPSSVVDYIDRNITIANGPLLNQLYWDNSFISEFNYIVSNTIYQINEDSNDKYSSAFIKRAEKIGFLLLMVSIMKKVSNSEQNVLNLWSKIEKSLVEIILDAVSHSGVEMNLNVIVNQVEIPGTCDLYEHIFTHTAAYVIGTTSEKIFYEIEKLLVSKILQPKFWTALLASDLLCLLARFGNNELRSSQARYFAHLLTSWPNENQRCSEWIYSIHVTARLIKMLPSHEGQSLLREYPLLTSCDFIWPQVYFDSSYVQNIYDSVEKFTNNKNSIEKSFQDMILNLHSTPYLNELDEYTSSKLVELLIKLWHCCAEIVNKTKDDFWVNKIMMILTVSSGVLVKKMDTEILNEVLTSLLIIVQHCNTPLKISLLRFLKMLSSKEIQSNGKHIEAFKKIAQLFAKLICDSDIFVNLIALETFKYFAGITKHVEIISFTAQIDRIVEQSLKAYLQGTFPANECTRPMEFEEYLNGLEQIKFQHKCLKTCGSVGLFKNIDQIKSGILDPCTQSSNYVSSVIPSLNNCNNQGKEISISRMQLNEELLVLLKDLNDYINNFLSSHENEGSSVQKSQNSSGSLCMLITELKSCLEKCKNIK